MNKQIEELYNKLDAQDKIINEQVLEIARLNKDLKDACYVIEKIKKEKQQAIELIKRSAGYKGICTQPETDTFSKLLEILGDKE